VTFEVESHWKIMVSLIPCW